MQFKSKDEVKRALAHSDTLVVESATLPLLFDSKGMNTLLYSDPFAKICFTCSVAAALKGKVVYLDLDTVFTSYVRNRICDVDPENIEIFLPGMNEFEPMLAAICSHMDDDVELVVMDSLNSFYHLYDKIKIGVLNQLLGTYISLLLNHTRRVGCKLLVTSMIRHKKAAEWILAPSSKRIVDARSTVILDAELTSMGLIIHIQKDQPLKLYSKRLVVAKGQIPIRF